MLMLDLYENNVQLVAPYLLTNLQDGAVQPRNLISLIKRCLD